MRFMLIVSISGVVALFSFDGHQPNRTFAIDTANGSRGSSMGQRAHERTPKEHLFSLNGRRVCVCEWLPSVFTTRSI